MLFDIKLTVMNKSIKHRVDCTKGFASICLEVYSSKKILLLLSMTLVALGF